jgi:hypothetical protein
MLPIMTPERTFSKDFSFRQILLTCTEANVVQAIEQGQPVCLQSISIHLCVICSELFRESIHSLSCSKRLVIKAIVER